MFDMTAPMSAGGRSGNNKSNKNTGHPQTPFSNQCNMGVYINEHGQTKDAWFREEDQMRKKLEK